MDVPHSSLFRRSLSVVGVVGDSGLIGAACEGGLIDVALVDIGCVAGAARGGCAGTGTGVATDWVTGPQESVLIVLDLLLVSVEGVLVRQGYERRGLSVWKGLGNVRRKAGHTRHYE